MSREELGTYNRQFSTYSGFLIERDRLSLRERDHLYLKGFPHSIRIPILRRLSIREPDVVPDDGYPFESIHEAAVFVLESRAHSLAQKFPLVTPQSEPPQDRTQIEELLEAIAALNQSITASVRESLCF